jgi:hypothetical protein
MTKSEIPNPEVKSVVERNGQTATVQSPTPKTGVSAMRLPKKDAIHHHPEVSQNSGPDTARDPVVCTRHIQLGY